MGIYNLFLSEVENELNRYPVSDRGVFTEEAILQLPDPVQKYIRVCGFLGKKQMTNLRVHWSEAEIRMGKRKQWLPLNCRQFNSVPEPSRIVYMKGTLGKIISMEGRDRCQNGKGNMLIKLFNLFPVVNATGDKMDGSALVTVLAETFLAPSYALQPYMRWQSIDVRSARASLSFQGKVIGGTFYFTDEGTMKQFTTETRWQYGNDALPIRWSALAGNYRRQEDILIPSTLAAVWHEADGDFEYFRGTIERLEYDISVFR